MRRWLGFFWHGVRLAILEIALSLIVSKALEVGCNACLGNSSYHRGGAVVCIDPAIEAAGKPGFAFMADLLIRDTDRGELIRDVANKMARLLNPVIDQRPLSRFWPTAAQRLVLRGCYGRASIGQFGVTQFRAF